MDYNEITRWVISLHERYRLKVLFSSDKLEEQCTNKKPAQKLLGGDTNLAISLLARVNALKQAETIKDIIVQPVFHFHKLQNKNGRDLEGYFAIDVKGRRDGWRIIIQPLDENEEPFDPCHIDKIASIVKVVEVSEVSKHYDD